MEKHQILSKKHTFFLGGNDLEMETIREIFADNNITSVYNKKLKWGAKLSSYKNELKELSKETIPVLIELQLDIKPPKNTEVIDHHNDKEDRPSSLEQIVKLLNNELNLEVKLNRWQKLVAANDKGYIPAMECLGATDEEIKKIREADRKAQGVTEEDERLSEESIAKNKTEENGITIIKSLTEKFSTITDRLYGKTKKLLIYTDDELTYYGKGKEKLVEKFNKEIRAVKAFHGGGNTGFWGVEKNRFTKEQIINLKNKIIKMNLEDSKPISHHIFLFPFKWDVKGEKKLENSNFKERVKLQDISNIFNEQSNFDRGINWQDYKFSLNRPRDYNEYTYFYEYVTATLFDDENNTNDKLDWKKIITLQYSLEFEKESKYLIDVVERKPWGKPNIPEIKYELKIENILLNFYQTGVGILSFHLSNYKYDKPEQILDINDFGRRIYPQYLDDGNIKKPLGSVKETFLANSISLKLELKNQSELKEIKDCFHSFCEPFNYNNPNEIKRMPKYISTLLGEKFNDLENNLNENDVKITPIIDDRMFTICWYGNDNCARKFSEKKWIKELNRYEYNYEKNELWNKFIFVDNSTSNNNANTNLLNKHNIQHSYSRWIDYGTLYGISRYSFIMVTDASKLSKNVFLPHIQTMYFQLVMLALLQRASLLRFSNEATKVKFIEEKKNENKSNEKNEDKKLEGRLDYIQELYKRYLHFVNKIFFREPTAQEQGIELYDMLLEKMRIEREVKDLNRELDEIHNYVTLLTQQKQNDRIEQLTIIGMLFLIPSLIAGIFGLTNLKEIDFSNFCDCTNWQWENAVLPIFLIALSFLLVKKFYKKIIKWLMPKENNKKK